MNGVQSTAHERPIVSLKKYAREIWWCFVFFFFTISFWLEGKIPKIPNLTCPPSHHPIFRAEKNEKKNSSSLLIPLDAFEVTDDWSPARPRPSRVRLHLRNAYISAGCYLPTWNPPTRPSQQVKPFDNNLQADMTNIALLFWWLFLFLFSTQMRWNPFKGFGSIFFCC